MSEKTVQREQVRGAGPIHAGLWAWIAVGVAISSGVTMFIFPASPAYSIGLAMLGLGSAWLARGVRDARVLVLVAFGLALLVMVVHLTVGLAWSGTTVSG